MQYFAGPDIRTNKLRIGDVVVNEDNVPIDSLILDRGYMLPLKSQKVIPLGKKVQCILPKKKSLSCMNT